MAAAALAPALLVGAASYFAAQSILFEKTQRSAGHAHLRRGALPIDSWLAERRQDAEIFANSFVITEALAQPSS